MKKEFEAAYDRRPSERWHPPNKGRVSSQRHASVLEHPRTFNMQILPNSGRNGEAEMPYWRILHHRWTDLGSLLSTRCDDVQNTLRPRSFLTFGSLIVLGGRWISSTLQLSPSSIRELEHAYYLHIESQESHPCYHKPKSSQLENCLGFSSHRCHNPVCQLPFATDTWCYGTSLPMPNLWPRCAEMLIGTTGAERQARHNNQQAVSLTFQRQGSLSQCMSRQRLKN